LVFGAPSVRSSTDDCLRRDPYTVVPPHDGVLLYLTLCHRAGTPKRAHRRVEPGRTPRSRN